MSNPLITPVGVPAGGSANGVEAGAYATGHLDIDGTPMRVAALGLSAAIALVALRMAGFRFNVGL